MISPLENVTWLKKTIKAHLNGHTCSLIVTQISTKWLSKTDFILLPIILTYLQYWFCFNRWRVGKASNVKVDLHLHIQLGIIIWSFSIIRNNRLKFSWMKCYSNNHKLINAMFQYLSSGKESVIWYNIYMK